MGLNSLAFALSNLGEDKGEAGREAVHCAWVVTEADGNTGEVVGEDSDLAEPMGAKGEVAGVCGLRNTWTRGEEGAEDGVSGRSLAELVDPREDGLEMGLRVGVKKRKGTPATSSRCLCMRSNTLWSACSKSNRKNINHKFGVN